MTDGRVLYCPLLKRTHLNFTAWVDSLTTRDDDWEWKHIDPVEKHESLSLHDVVFPLITGLKSNLFTDLTSQNNAENSCTRGSQKVLGNPLLTENDRQDSACSDVVVSLACLLAVATGLVSL